MSRGKRKSRRESPAGRHDPTKTPLRAALRAESALQAAVKDGLGAVQSAHRGYFAEEIRSQFGDSLELDEAVRREHQQSNRWDYLLGHSQSGAVVGVEPHSAYTKEVSVVIAKRVAAMQHLRGHLRDGAKVAQWIWVASGRVDLVPFDRAKRRLDEAGITFVGGQVKAKDLAPLSKG